MGSQFAIIYDIITVALLIGMMFAGFKRGFASAVVSLAAVAVGFICAITISQPISDAVYTNLVDKPVNEAVSSVMDDTLSSITLTAVADADFSGVRINGVSIEDITPDHSGSNKLMFDLSSVDYTGTGITVEELSAFGFSDETDLSNLNGKIAEFTITDIERYGLGKLVMAQVISVQMQGTQLFKSFAEFAETVGEIVPVFFGGMAEDIANGGIAELRSVIVIMLHLPVTASEAVVNGIVEPCVRIAVQTLAFVIIFSVVTIVLNLLAKLLKFVNKIPVIGGLNSFCGGLVGIAEGLLGVFIVCLLVRLVTILSGGNIMFFNNSAIETTHVFKVFYNFEFLNFIN